MFENAILLDVAYVISVEFYLRLLASFLLHAMAIESGFYANLLTTDVLG